MQEEETKRDTEVGDINIRLTHSESQRERQLLHPLELNDKLAFDTIKTVRLDFLTEEAKAPIPRCQALPEHAFSRLTGRSILVSLSHGWFFQTHPDPYGEKLDLIRNVFAPRLRGRYPHTDIQVFFDYLASPQRPRTKSEDKIFADSDISSLRTDLFSVNLYILGIIFEKTNMNAMRGSKNLAIVSGIDK